MTKTSHTLPEAPVELRRRRWRLFKDAAAKHLIAIGGIGVIIAIVMILFYLLYVVVPLFKPASIEKAAGYPVPAQSGKTLYLALEEQAEIGLRAGNDGSIRFFSATDGKPVLDVALPLPAGARITSFAAGEGHQARLAFGLSNGQALVVRHNYDLTYTDNARHITPKLDYPLGTASLSIDPKGKSLLNIAFQDGDDEATLAAMTEDGRLLLAHFTKEESLLGDEVEIEASQVEISLEESLADDLLLDYLLLDKEQRNLYVADADGTVSHFDISDKQDIVLVQRLRLVDVDQRITSMRFLTGDISLLVADDSGRIVQWFNTRDERGNLVLTPVREFHAQSGAISDIAAEYNRKGFLAVDRQGRVGIYNATAERVVLEEQLTNSPLSRVTIAPRGNAMLVEDADGQLHFWRIHNEHPEISWSALWAKVWYESYDEPVYAWQSSAANNDFEPKLSLTPLVFGTIKAAFYAMVVAIPLAILGAIYTAYFMSPGMRRVVKPGIEIIEALPTVILGFLAGLWLAPYVEAHLPGIFSLLLIVPLGVLLFAFAWHRVPPSLRLRIPEGWDAALLIPLILLLAWAAVTASPAVEEIYFQGDMRKWLVREFGIGFDQRNALVVGIAMGFAVIPMIFSIAEDAIFSVPRHLTDGSLALGATTWQTLTRVVILTASPGIFSAIMIGLGRAVGETMIVLMATGNTPVMDFSIFQGMRTLSANIAVEMPESEVDSTHYRVLFLAALVLFLFTFLFNTLAEIVRQRLRVKYSSL